MRRFLITPIAADEITITLGKEESHHICRVLRLQEGDSIELFDGQSMVYQASITTLGKQVTAKIETSQAVKAPKPHVHLHLGLLKGKKMDMIVQKATELGVHAIHPFISEFTEAKPPKEHKMERWQKISLEACKQCRRNWPLILNAPTPLQAQLENLPEDATSFLFWEDEKVQDPTGLPPLANYEELHLFIGPEGGFAPAEVTLCQQKMESISLGPLTLRAETAVITALSLVLFLGGRMHNKD